MRTFIILLLDHFLLVTKDDVDNFVGNTVVQSDPFLREVGNDIAYGLNYPVTF
jgi:hypothetical protein